MKNLNDLAVRMKALEKRLPLALNELTKGVAKNVLKSVVTGTPVDTSKAISNWQVRLDKDSFSTREPHYPGDGGNTREASIATTIRIGLIFIDKKLPGKAINIGNKLDYIEALDAGKSRQNSNFVESAITVGRATLNRAKLKL